MKADDDYGFDEEDYHDAALSAEGERLYEEYHAQFIEDATEEIENRRHLRLKRAREAAGYVRASDFADKYGIPRSTYSLYESGKRSLPLDRCIVYSRHLNAAWQELMYGDFSFIMADEVMEPENWQSKPPKIEEYDFVPEYSFASDSKGNPLDESDRTGYLAFRPGWLSAVTRASPAKLAVVTVIGDSMEPTMRDGDTLLVDTSVTTVASDGIYVLKNEGGLQPKRLTLNPGNKRVSAVSDNQAYCSYDEIDPSDLDIFGRAIWHGGRL